MTPASSSRRELLALAGVAAVSGCAGLLGRNEPRTIDGSKFAQLGNPPAVARPLPVSVDAGHVDDVRRRATSLLGDLPGTFGPSEIPNEAVRTEIGETRERARAELRAADDTPSTAERLEQLRRARGSAAMVATAWQSIDGELDRATVREHAPAIQSDLSDFRRRWRYVGDDPIRAVVVHETLETLVHQADVGTTDDVEANARRPENAVTIGLLAGELERASAALDDATHLFDQFDASTSGDVSSTIDSSIDEIVSTLEDRREALPDGNVEDPSSFVEPDVSDTPAAWALERLYRAADDLDWVRAAKETDRPASAVLRAHDRLARYEAFESLRERVNDGETFAVSDAADVLSRRVAALTAIEDALAASSHPLLARSTLSTIAAGVRRLDDRLTRMSGEVSVDSISDNVGEYVAVEMMARTVPVADEVVAGALDVPEDNP